MLKQADTSCYLLLRILFSDSQCYGTAYGISIASGLGKTYVAKKYVEDHPENTRLITVEKDFISKIDEFSKSEIKNKLLIIDNFELISKKKLNDFCRYFQNGFNFGLIVMFDNSEKHRLLENKLFYNLFSRRLISLNSLSQRDVEVFCRAKDISDEDLIEFIKNKWGNSLSDVEKLINQIKK